MQALATAGIGTRVLNFVIDTIISFILSIILFKVYNFYVRFYGYPGLNFGWFFWGTIFLYYFLLETFFARSVAKWLTYTKVVNQQGQKPNIGQLLIRSVARIIIIDCFFIPFLDKTLHDYLSKTEVVRAA